MWLGFEPMSDRDTPPSLDDLPALMRGPEVAAVLRVTPAHVRALARGGHLPASRVGGARSEWLYDKRRLVAMIEGGDPWQELPPLLGDAPEVLRTSEVAAFLRLSRPFVAELTNEGAIKGFRHSPRGEWRYSSRSIAALAEPTNAPAKDDGKAEPPAEE